MDGEYKNASMRNKQRAVGQVTIPGEVRKGFTEEVTFGLVFEGSIKFRHRKETGIRRWGSEGGVIVLSQSRVICRDNHNRG